MDKKPDIILVTETWCNDSINNAMLSIPGYKIEPSLRVDRADTANGIGGGILIYVRDELTVLLNDKNSDFNQYCSFKLKLSGRTNFLEIVIVYRSPNSTKENDQKLCDLILEVDDNCIITGDFNFPNIDWETGTSDSKGKRFLEVCREKSLEQLVYFPTHSRGNTLDLVLTDTDNVINVEDVGRLGKSDHCMLMIETQFDGNVNETDQMMPNWSKADINSIRQTLSNIDWRADMNNLSTEEAWYLFKSVVDESIRQHVPTIKRRSPNKPPWMNQNVLRSLRKKHRLWRRYSKTKSYQLLEEYKRQEKKAQKDIRQAKRKFERKLSKNNGRGNRLFNSYIKKKTKTKTSVGPLKNLNGETVTDDQGMSEILNSFFSSVFTDEGSGPIPSMENLPCAEKIRSVNFEKKDICEKIRKLKSSCAPGPDKICAKYLQLFENEVAGPLQIIFTKSLAEGSVPEDWKSANITPIYKKGLKNNAGNYRPVSLTSLPCKIMESILRDKLTEHLLNNNLILSSQHGFLQNKSCVTNLLEFFETVTTYVDQGTPMDIAYLDFSKAFDKVPRLRLLNKLRAHSIDGNILKWMESWLSGRKQRVVLNGKYSAWEDVLSGVPQGSVLGPLAFIVYINDIDLIAHLVMLLLKFADDTKVGHKVVNDADRSALQSCLDELYEWSVKWGMSFNIEKCKIMHVGKKNPSFEYTMNGLKLKSTEQEKDIGVLIHDSLKPSRHCAESARKANGILTQISKSFHYRDKVTFLNLYKTYVRCHLESSVPAWNPWSAQDKEVIEKVQIRAVNMISGLKGSTYPEKLAELKLMTLEARRTRFDMLQTFKIVHGMDRVNRDTWFKMAAEHSQRVTRLSADPLNIQPQTFNGDIRKNFFSNRVVETWNNLPSDIKASRNVQQFKSKYDKLVHQQVSS